MNDVSRWMLAGAGVPEGLRLLGKYSPNRHVSRLVEAQPARYRWLLEKCLEPFADGAIAPARPMTDSGKKFREQWPFLSDPSCPMELKALAADKITAYHTYCDAHEKLFDCISLEECFETAKKVVENFRQNRLISAEFAYFKEHGSVLGKHPVFKRYRKMESYRRMGIVSLIAEQRRLKGAVWRIESEIRKGDKPSLLTEREARLRAKREALELVTQLISESGAA